MADYVVNFDAGQKVRKSQTARIGDNAFDVAGNLWSYVKFATAGKPGIVWRDSVSADLISNSGVGAVTAAAAVGSVFLEDTGEFANKDLVGAIGFINAGSGKGQSFEVVRMVSDDVIEISVLTTATGFHDGTSSGWVTALTTSSRYSIYFPGYVRPGANISSVVRGLGEVEVKTEQIDEHGWVKQKGLGFGKLDASGHAPAVGDGVVPTANGLVRGLNAGAPANLGAVPGQLKELSAIIGECVLGDISGNNASDDSLIPLKLSIENTVKSYRFHKTKVALSSVDVRRS